MEYRRYTKTPEVSYRKIRLKRVEGQGSTRPYHRYIKDEVDKNCQLHKARWMKEGIIANSHRMYNKPYMLALLHNL
jgi:hypothetical protein